MAGRLAVDTGPRQHVQGEPAHSYETGQATGLAADRLLRRRKDRTSATTSPWCVEGVQAARGKPTRALSQSGA